ncbi:MAG: hypothetical protein ACK2U9_24745, partial [Anaerolineae bacterium]
MRTEPAPSGTGSFFRWDQLFFSRVLTMAVRHFARRPEAALFALTFVAYAYFYQAGGWNQNSRFDLTRAIVEQRTATIDRYHRNTGDLACRGPEGRCQHPRPARGDHAYCDKAPGVSWLAAPAYAVVYAVAGRERPSPRYLAVASYLSTVWAVAVPAALAVALLFSLLGALGLSPGGCTAISLAYGLGTLAFPYATLFYGHQLVAALLAVALALLVQARRGSAGEVGTGRLLLVGVLLGLAVAVEYPAALGVIPLSVYAATFVRPWKRLLWLVAGGAVMAIGLALYHLLVYGGPLSLPYQFSTQEHRGQGFFMGLGAPSGEALWHILVSGYRGLFYSAPWLLLAIPGAVLALWRGRFRAEMTVCLVVALLFVWLNASLVDWEGGWAMGPRYLVPAIPFLAILAAGLPLSLGAGSSSSAGEGPLTPKGKAWHVAGWAIAVGLAAYSTFLMLVGTAVKPEVDVRIRKPFSQFLLERFYAGDLSVSTQSIDSASAPPGGARQAWNLGEKLLGLEGLSTLIPLALVAG